MVADSELALLMSMSFPQHLLSSFTSLVDACRISCELDNDVLMSEKHAGSAYLTTACGLDEYTWSRMDVSLSTNMCFPRNGP